MGFLLLSNAFEHSGTKGDASEHVWLEFLKIYLPERYRAEKAHVVDSKGVFSQQIDVVVFDRQYSPLIFTYEGQIVLRSPFHLAARDHNAAVCETLLFAYLFVVPAGSVELRQDVPTAGIRFGEKSHVVLVSTLRKGS